MCDADFAKTTMGKVESYLNGSLSAKDASDWALKVVVARELDDLPVPVQDAIVALFDLHDTDDRWCTSREELLSCLRRWRRQSE